MIDLEFITFYFLYAIIFVAYYLKVYCIWYSPILGLESLLERIVVSNHLCGTSSKEPRTIEAIAARWQVHGALWITTRYP